MLSQRRDVDRVSDLGGELRVVLAAGVDASDINRALVVAGIGVRRLEPARVSLEERFLELTSAVGGAR
jgi:hypothetical protein